MALFVGYGHAIGQAALPTTKATVNTALNEVLALLARGEALLDGTVAGRAELADEQRRRAAWG